ncbi:ABC transporter ATP-binding protein [Egibacter rhizosphaerae]|uniref:ABC-type quaternary amine transporter n=1 Tax=Egibacter rhizosphaerae TaxID=1670831 RepID=A0A411YHY8_9ACTN|nr:ABC transporter ATP-binding protein [Egibacter rhizosphaerae]QBI20878.1 ABC transporter ATP-binding protein [Egibacter rhizosphaerae]
MADAHLQLVNLRKTFGEDVAVDHVDMAIERGSFTCLLGPSGCGKTTTLRMIAGFVDPDDGDVLIGGVSQIGRSAHRRPTSIVFQDYALFPHMTVEDNVAYGLRTAKIDKETVERRTRETLELMGLEGLAKRYPRQLSGGQQQRTALARSVVTEPEVLLMDEPLSNLDAKLRARLRTDLRALQQRLGITTLYVTHDQEEALAMGDAVAVMFDGRIEQSGTPHELYYEPETPFVADFIGMNNFIPCEMRKFAEGQIVVELADHQRLEFDGARISGGDVSEGEETALVIRPEALSVDVDGSATAGAEIQGSLIGSQFLGPLRRHWVKVAGTEVVIDEYDPDLEPIAEPDDPVRVRLPTNSITIMKGGAEKATRGDPALRT